MSDDAADDRSSEIERRAFLKRMIAVGFVVPVVTSFEPSDAAAHHKDKHKKNQTTSTTSTTATPTTSLPPTTSPPGPTTTTMGPAPTTTGPP